MFLVFDSKLPKFLALVKPVLTFRLTFMLVTVGKKNVLFDFFFFCLGRVDLIQARYSVLRCLRSSHPEVAAHFFTIFSYLSFAVHLPLLHEYRTIFHLTFSSA